MHQALESRHLPHGLRLLLWENSLAEKKGSKYIDRVKVFVEEALSWDSSQMHVSGVIYFMKVSILNNPSLTLAL